MKYKKPSEHQIQSAFMELLAWKYPKIREITFAIPNGGFRHIGTARKLKAEGSKAGVADVFVMQATGLQHGLWIEFKAGYGKQSDAQIAFERLAIRQSYEYIVCYSVDEAIDKINKYFG